MVTIKKHVQTANNANSDRDWTFFFFGSIRTARHIAILQMFAVI